MNDCRDHLISILKLENWSLGLWSEDKEGRVGLGNITKDDSQSQNQPGATQNKSWLNLLEQAKMKYNKARHEETCRNKRHFDQNTQHIKQQKQDGIKHPPLKAVAFSKHLCAKQSTVANCRAHFKAGSRKPAVSKEQHKVLKWTALKNKVIQSLIILSLKYI